MRTLLPPGWPRPKGYSNGIEAEGRIVFVAGQIGWTAEEKFEATTFAGQFAQALDNTLAVLREANAGPENVARMTWYITDKRAYLAALAEVGAAWRERMGRNYPAMAVVEVKALIEDQALIEIETTAIIPR
ncbi:RidA family protein [Terricaulis sp.]|uniref:RidA family protein n=1 Tax=Terricaulis sp. TaxID=2768686 RepID=UPI00378472A2